MPQNRYVNARGDPLNRYGVGPFCKFTIPRTCRQSGVYLIMAGNDLEYVGECANLAARFNAGYGNISPKNCFKGGQETNCRLNNLIYVATSGGEAFALWFHSTPDYKTVEATLRAKPRAPWNRAQNLPKCRQRHVTKISTLILLYYSLLYDGCPSHRECDVGQPPRQAAQRLTARYRPLRSLDHAGMVHAV